MATAHTCNDGHGPNWGKRTARCPRCDELAAGAEPVTWSKPQASSDSYSGHDCRVSRCGSVCTAGDW